MKQSDAAVQRVRQEMTDASMEEIHQLKQDNEVEVDIARSEYTC